MEKLELSRLPVSMVQAACTNQAVLSIVNSTKSFATIPKEELIFILLSILYADEESSQERLDLMRSFVEAYKIGNLKVEKSPDDDYYILYQTGTISIDIGFFKKHNIQV